MKKLPLVFLCLVTSFNACAGGFGDIKAMVASGQREEDVSRQRLQQAVLSGSVTAQDYASRDGRKTPNLRDYVNAGQFDAIVWDAKTIYELRAWDSQCASASANAVNTARSSRAMESEISGQISGVRESREAQFFEMRERALGSAAMICKDLAKVRNAYAKAQAEGKAGDAAGVDRLFK